MTHNSIKEYTPHRTDPPNTSLAKSGSDGPKHNCTASAAVPATTPERNGLPTASKTSRGEMLVPLMHHAMCGKDHTTIITEKPKATPFGPYGNPTTYPPITRGARTS